MTTAGTVVKCRPVLWKGAHSPPNAGKIGVVLCGSYGRDKPSEKQIETLRWMLHDGASVGIPHGLTLKGHRDLNDTSCPGNKLYAVLDQVRAAGTPQPTPVPKPGVIQRWYDDPAFVRRVQLHLDWAFRSWRIPHEHIAADGVLGPGTRAAIKLAKFYLGYLKVFQVWALGVDQRFLDRLHHPGAGSFGLSEAAAKRGRERRDRARQHPTTRATLAEAILAHRNARFAFVSPTGGSAKDGLQRTARGEKAHVAATGANVLIDTRVLAFLLDLCDHGTTLINCIVNGRHMAGSQHYSGQAVDIDKGSASVGAVYTVAKAHDLTVLNEDAYHFHVHV